MQSLRILPQTFTWELPVGLMRLRTAPMAGRISITR